MNQEKIGKFIRKCRKEKNITQQDLANKLNVTDKAISKWENGRCLMDISLLKPLSECLGVSIVELINGEKIEENEISKKSTEIVEKTLKYADKKIKKSRVKIILLTCIILMFVYAVVFCSYKGVLLHLHNVSNDRFEKVVSGLDIKNTLNIYKRTIDSDRYLVLDDIKIRNDFSDFEVEKAGDGEFVSTTYRSKDDDGKTIAAITIGSFYNHIDVFESDEVFIMSGNDSNIRDFGQFNAADRKYFLLKNDINNDLDFFKFIRENGYLESNIFSSKREIQENYAYNLFVHIVMPEVDSISVINGDYSGFTFNYDDKNIRQVTIFRNGKSYNFLLKGNDYITDEYICDLFSTLEIK